MVRSGIHIIGQILEIIPRFGNVLTPKKLQPVKHNQRLVLGWSVITTTVLVTSCGFATYGEGGAAFIECVQNLCTVTS